VNLLAALGHGDGALLLMALTSLTLYALLGHRTWILWGSAAAVVEPAAGLGVIRALIAALPLLGLLASVGGISETFHLLSLSQGDQVSRTASQGIGLALHATQAGLVAAIPALVWERLIDRRATELTRNAAWSSE
jgi:biopolymer transport protein ExbB/TolQ